MIYLTTGANGTGKTLLTLKDVRERQLAEVRPVSYNGRFDLVADFGWKKIDAKDWQAEPDGTIFLFDECHNDFAAASGKAEVPMYINGMAEHRRRGMDFYLITQHPMMLHANVRRIIGDPGWHRHLKRVGGASLVSVAKWPSVKDQPQKHGASADAGSVDMVPFPKEVYPWYNSASLHTAKLKIPTKVKVGVLAAIMVPLLLWLAFRSLQTSFTPPKVQTGQAATTPAGQVQAPAVAAPGQAGGSFGPGKGPLSAPEYVASFRPRVDGLAYTAPRYDDVTKPTVAPFPAACVTMGGKCLCYSQQATRLQVPAELCLEIVKNGYFQDWGEQRRPGDLPAKLAGQQTSDSAVPSGGPQLRFQDPVILGRPASVSVVAQAENAAPYPRRRVSAPH